MSAKPKAKNTINVTVNLSPKGAQALDLLDDPNGPSLLGWGGSRGSAKSFTGRTIMLLRRFKYPGTRAMVWRKTRPQLWDNHISKLMQEWPELYQKLWNGDANALVWPDGGMLAFRYGDTLKDVLEQRGRDWDDILIDEATDHTEEELKILGATCRSTRPNYSARKMFTFNPGGPGHAYIKRLFIDNEPTSDEAKQKIAFIQAYAWDNHLWAQDALAVDGVSFDEYFRWSDDRRAKYLIERTDYGRELNALPHALREAWLWGKWDVFAGQYFDIWDPRTMVAKRETQPWYQYWLSIDWGFRHPSVVYLHTADDSGDVYTFGEICVSGRTPPELASDIVAMVQTARVPEVSNVYLSPDAFGVTASDRTIADEIGAVLTAAGLPAPERADTDRKGGAVLMYQLLQSGRWKIGPSCPALIKCLPAMQHDPKGLGDVVKFDAMDGKPGDDPYDSARYGIKSHKRISEKPITQRVMEYAQAAGLEWNRDLTSWNIQRQKIESDLIERAAPMVSLRGHGYGRQAVQRGY